MISSPSREEMGPYALSCKYLCWDLQPTLSKHGSGSHGHTTAFMSSQTNPEPPDLFNTKKKHLLDGQMNK